MNTVHLTTLQKWISKLKGEVILVHSEQRGLLIVCDKHKKVHIMVDLTCVRAWDGTRRVRRQSVVFIDATWVDYPEGPGLEPDPWRD